MSFFYSLSSFFLLSMRIWAMFLCIHPFPLEADSCVPHAHAPFPRVGVCAALGAAGFRRSKQSLWTLANLTQPSAITWLYSSSYLRVVAFDSCPDMVVFCCDCENVVIRLCPSVVVCEQRTELASVISKMSRHVDEVIFLAPQSHKNECVLARWCFIPSRNQAPRYTKSSLSFSTNPSNRASFCWENRILMRWRLEFGGASSWPLQYPPAMTATVDDPLAFALLQSSCCLSFLSLCTIPPNW